MARRTRKAKKTREQLCKDYKFNGLDKEYQYFHLGHLETIAIGKEVERKLIEKGVLADKSLTVSGCWSFRWKRDAYDLDMLNSITQVVDYSGIVYIQKPWVPLPAKEAETPKKRRRRRKT